jgi:methyl-accepting chemotaxis protein
VNPPAHQSSILALAELSEAAKTVMFAAVQLHLLGLNARVLATRMGDEGRAFSVLSAEWVLLSKRFGTAMHQLERLTETLLRGISRTSINRNRARLLVQCEGPLKAYGASFGTRAQPELAEAKLELNAVVDEALRGVLLGQVIARSAKIEAGWSATSRETLANMAEEFEHQLADILPPLRSLRALQRQGLT